MGLRSTISVLGHSSGRWYFEVSLDTHNFPNGGSSPGGFDVYVGISPEKPFLATTNGGAYLGSYRHTLSNGSETPETSHWTIGARIGVAVCFTDTGVNVWFSINGVWEPGGMQYDEESENYSWSGTGEPDSSADGGSLPTGENLAPGLYYAAAGVTFEDVTLTLYERSTEFAYPIPDSYSAWRT